MDCFFSDLMEKLDYETYCTEDNLSNEVYDELYENEEQKPSKKEVKCFWKSISKKLGKD